MMIRIGGASGYWGDSPRATPQLLDAGVDVLVYDYLAEITMSLLARAKMKDPSKGYATDFPDFAMKPHLRRIADQGVRVVSNAGGINPLALARALEELIAEQDLRLKVAVVTGDDLMPQLREIAEDAPPEFQTGAPFPDPQTIVSANAYLGAFGIAEALGGGADIVVTGRTVDSAATLGALIAHYGWKPDELDKLAAGSLVGHLLECGVQATGGNFTDWRAVPRREAIGYPIAEVTEDGVAVITKPEGSGGLVTRGTVGEQLVYEIGDPQDYRLPDVTCDFSAVSLTEEGPDRVRVEGARGRPAPPKLKVSATYVAGWRGGMTPVFYGPDAGEKAEAFARAVFARAEETLRIMQLPPFAERSVETIGSGGLLGENDRVEEVTLKIAARHPDQAGIAVLLKEIAGMGLATPPGLCGFASGRPKPSPVVQLFSFLIDRHRAEENVHSHGDGHTGSRRPVVGESEAKRPEPPALPSETEPMVNQHLGELAWVRSGDKGDSANIGVIARDPEALPYLWAALTTDLVADRFAHVTSEPVRRYLMPGPAAINFVLERSLGGGGIASLRTDPQGKGFSQLLLDLPVRLPERLAQKGAR
jgi:hypothetical protein